MKTNSTPHLLDINQPPISLGPRTPLLQTDDFASIGLAAHPPNAFHQIPFDKTLANFKCRQVIVFENSRSKIFQQRVWSRLVKIGRSTLSGDPTPLYLNQLPLYPGSLVRLQIGSEPGTSSQVPNPLAFGSLPKVKQSYKNNFSDVTKLRRRACNIFTKTLHTKTQPLC